jgi:hypothetical protein
VAVTRDQSSPGGRANGRSSQATGDQQGASRPADRAPNVRRASPLGLELEPDDLAVW